MQRAYIYQAVRRAVLVVAFERHALLLVCAERCCGSWVFQESAAQPRFLRKARHEKKFPRFFLLRFKVKLILMYFEGLNFAPLKAPSSRLEP